MESSILGLNNFCFRSSCSLRLWQWTWTSATLYALDVVILAALSPLPNLHHLSTLFWLNNYQRGQPDLSRDQRRDNVMPVQHTASLICSSISFGELYLSISLALCVYRSYAALYELTKTFVVSRIVVIELRMKLLLACICSILSETIILYSRNGYVSDFAYGKFTTII